MAAFAQAGPGRTLAMLMVAGLLIGLVMSWLARSAWFPPVAKAIERLPLEGQVVRGRLEWAQLQPVTLAANRFLAVAVDLEHTGLDLAPADVQLEWGATNLYVRGILGHVEVPYPPEITLAFNSRELVPWWGAWSQAILAGVCLGSALALMVIWTGLALLYVPLARVTAWLRGAELSVGAAWRLCAAALMPGALLMTAAMVAYGWGWLDMLRLGLVAVFHLVVGWVYVPLSVCCLPRSPQTTRAKGNPFAFKV